MLLKSMKRNAGKFSTFNILQRVWAGGTKVQMDANFSTRICPNRHNIYLSVGGLAFGRGNAKARTGAKTFKFPQNFLRAGIPHDAKSLVGRLLFTIRVFVLMLFAILFHYKYPQDSYDNY